jgi:hypothetical protein
MVDAHHVTYPKSRVPKKPTDIYEHLIDVIIEGENNLLSGLQSIEGFNGDHKVAFQRV